MPYAANGVVAPNTGFGGSPSSLAVAGLNGGGRPDVLTANWDDNSVGVFFSTVPLATRAALPGTSASRAPNPAGAATTLSVAGLPTAVTRVQATVLDAEGREVSRQALGAAQGTARCAIYGRAGAGAVHRAAGRLRWPRRSARRAGHPAPDRVLGAPRRTWLAAPALA